ncbi:hypothetical protein AGROH133_12245 [Agrobacterium tumefaciens]|nr:hypothetical protein AGROH133_12245 [Agrobacterium tumefaciens]
MIAILLVACISKKVFTALAVVFWNSPISSQHALPRRFRALLGAGIHCFVHKCSSCKLAPEI